MRSKSYGRESRGNFIDSRADTSMKTRIVLFPALALVAMAAALVAIKAHAMTNPTTTASLIQTELRTDLVTLNFGSFGIAQGQVARINLVSLRQPRTAEPPQPDHAELMFLGEDGKVLATQRVAVAAGQSASFEVSMEALGLTSTRLQLRAKVRFTDPPIPDAEPPGPDKVTIATVEVKERSGRTSFMLPYFIVGGDPPGELGQ